MLSQHSGSKSPEQAQKQWKLDDYDEQEDTAAKRRNHEK